VRCSSGRAAVLAVALGAAAACTSDDLVIPQPPDLTAVAAIYEMPTGTVDPQRASEVAAQAQARFGELQLDWLPRLVADALAGLRQRLTDTGLPTDPATTGVDDDDDDDDDGDDSKNPWIDAVVHLQRICRGWSEPPGAPDAAQNGTLDLTAVVQRSRLGSTVWGTATACRARVAVGSSVAVNGFLEGTVTVYLYGGVPRELADTRALVQVTGRIGTEVTIQGNAQTAATPGGTASGSFDFRVIYPQVEIRVPVADGDVIASVGLDAIEIRARNGSYRCDLPALTCHPG
jgi:hypothetical protein